VFEWDASKAASNAAKHRVTFADATTAFVDPNGLDSEDIVHSGTEPRRLRLARAASGNVLVIAYTRRVRRDGQITRIISARRASRNEKQRYEIFKD
jgi:hypothetical protein